LSLLITHLQELYLFEQNLLQKVEYKLQQAQRNRLPSKMVVSSSQSSARVHDFELCSSHGCNSRRSRTSFDSKHSPKQKNIASKKQHKDHHRSPSSSAAAKLCLFDKFRDMQQRWHPDFEEEDGDSEGVDETSRTFERLVQRSALEEEVS
jgi:hypothetical protein